MHFQWTDLVVAVIMLISGLLALARGFTREVLSLIAWGVAGLAGLASALNPQIVAAAQQYIPQEIAAKIAVGAGVFLVVLIIMSLISIKISDWVLDAPVGPFDRTLGFAYGLVRGLLLVVIAYFFYDLFVPRDKQDEVVRTARFLPIVQSVRNTAVSMLPAQIQERIQNMTSIESGPPSAATQPSQAEPGEEDQGSGYRDTQRNAIDQMIESTQGAPAAPANPQPAPPQQQQQQQQDQPNFGGQEGN
jgi:membrane protein required for colicin V production